MQIVAMIDRVYAALADYLTPGGDVGWRWELKNKVLRQAGLKIGQDVAVDRGFEWLAHAGAVTLADHVVIGRNVKIYNFSDVSIGSFCMFAGDVLIANGGHNTSTFEPFSGALSIGRGCWIGTGVKIVGADLEIGDNAVLGAGALVNKSVPPGAIVGGVPARILGYRQLPEKVWHLGGKWFSPFTFELVK